MASNDLEELLLEFRSAAKECEEKLKNLRVVQEKLTNKIAEYEQQYENEIEKCKSLEQKLHLNPRPTRGEQEIDSDDALPPLQPEEPETKLDYAEENTNTETRDPQKKKETRDPQIKTETRDPKIMKEPEETPFCDQFLKFGVNSHEISVEELKHQSLWSQPSQVLETWPESTKVDIRDITHFACPDNGEISVQRVSFTTPPKHQIKKENCHVFTTTDFDTGTKTYGFCITIPVYRQEVQQPGGQGFLRTEVCYCLRSRHVFFDLFYETICHIIESPEHKDEILQNLLATKVPSNGDSCVIPLFGYKRARFERPSIDATLVIEWSSVSSWSTISAEYLTSLLQMTLTEHKIIVVGKPSVCTAAVLCLTAMCSPVHWNHILITLLPEKLHGTLGSPMPFLAGVTHLSSQQIDERSDDVGIWYPESGKLTLPQSFEPSDDTKMMEPLLKIYLRELNGVHDVANLNYAKRIYENLRSFVEDARDFIANHRNIPKNAGMYGRFNPDDHQSLANPGVQ